MDDNKLKNILVLSRIKLQGMSLRQHLGLCIAYNDR